MKRVRVKAHDARDRQRAKRLDRARAQGQREGRHEMFIAMLEHLEAHTCVASCCDANISGEGSFHLANCLRSNMRHRGLRDAP